MNSDEFAKLFAYMQGMRSEMATKEDIESLNISVDAIRNILDSHFKMLETDEVERMALTSHVNRIQDWIDRTSPKIDAVLDTK